MIESTNTRYSDKFYFYKKDKIIGNSLKYYGEYSQIEIDLLLKLLNANCIVYDVGANIGYHTTAFASHVSKVYSFEPNPNNFKLLKKNTSKLNNVKIINAAVGDHSGTIKIQDFDPNKDDNNYGMMKCGDIGVDVKLISIDNCGLEKPDLIKIDVEGYEYPVIKGCEKLLETRRPIIYYEAHETLELKEIYEFLVNYQYTLYWIVVPDFNPNNYKNLSNNVFGINAVISILAYPNNLGFLPLSPVLGPTDHFSRFITYTKNTD